MNQFKAACLCSLFVSAGAAAQDADRKAKQADLDATCEAARQVKIIQARAELIEECVEQKERPDRASCDRYYADFGQNSARVPALFYDLPECVAAHEFRRSYRSAGN